MKILVFGATGSIGVYTTTILKEKGYEVVAVGRRRSDNGFFADYQIPYYSMDIKNIDEFKVLPKDIDAVIHLAGAMPAHVMVYNPYEYTNSILNGTLNILEYIRECSCTRILFSQSIADVGYKFGTTVPIPDDSEMHFPLNSDHSVYSICKNAAVHLMQHYHAKYGIKYFALRLPTIYGYHPNPFYYVDGKRKWLGYRFLIEQAIKGETLELWGNPSNIKEMVCIYDLVHLMDCCLNADVEGGIYNVGCGHSVTFEEQLNVIADVFQTVKRSDIVYKPNLPSSPQFVLDISKAVNELGYSPKFDIRRLMECYKQDYYNEPFSKLLGKRLDYIDKKN